MKKINLELIRERYKNVEDNSLYNPEQIFELGLISDNSLKPSVFAIYRLLRGGKLPYLNHGVGKAPRYFVKGSVLKEFIKKRYSL